MIETTTAYIAGKQGVHSIFISHRKAKLPQYFKSTVNQDVSHQTQKRIKPQLLFFLYLDVTETPVITNSPNKNISKSLLSVVRYPGSKVTEGCHFTIIVMSLCRYLSLSLSTYFQSLSRPNQFQYQVVYINVIIASQQLQIPPLINLFNYCIKISKNNIQKCPFNVDFNPRF